MQNVEWGDAEPRALLPLEQPEGTLTLRLTSAPVGPEGDFFI
jgi:hypothetical protein